MSTDDYIVSPPDPEATFTELLTYAELLNTPRLARLYSYILQNGPIGMEAIKRDLEMAHSTTYKYVGQLEEMDVLTRHDDGKAATVTVAPIHLEIETDHGEVTATPTLVDAIGRQLDNEDIRVFVERQGVAKLAAALHYTLRVMNGELTQRTAANKLDVHRIEGMTVITTLQDVVAEATAYDPYVERPK
ncbi:transcriptional regulator TrmB [Natronorubrum sp. JWXQ-INN-674]|uniref:Transcriptional regulator TrmB n=1 Tax=Natronorubrum halalkaliphilum TaxID=2691917 RepID=A0A6B0VHR0_9EURY|nr:transcriptional regulator TrmB [Natronorubrum halalkaliphilum]MXV60617.1 transcriptional regulator TrmB [Natronorubrum halalkaliphilum]